MAITFVNTTNASGANPTLAIPSGVVKNDLLLIFTTSSSTPATPSGWTQLAAQGAGQFITVFFKYATAVETSVALSIANTNTNSCMAAFRGAGAFQLNAAFSTGTGTSATTNTLTTTYGNNAVISIAANPSGTSRSWGGFGTGTGILNGSSTTAVNGLLVAREIQTAAGTSTARSSTISVSSDWSALQISFIEDRTVYWVGGSGGWVGPGAGVTGANWADSSGGAGGVIVPTQNDAVIVDANSGSPTMTLSGPPPVCASFTTTGATCTLTGFALEIHGNTTLSPTTTVSNNGLFLFGTGTITTNGVTIGGVVTISGVSQTITLGDALTTNSNMSIFNGTLALNGFNATCRTFGSSGTTARGVNFGANFINIFEVPVAGTPLDIANATLFTPIGTGGFRLTGASGSGESRTITVGTTGGSVATAPNVFVAAGASGSIVAITNGSWVRDLNFTGFSGTFTAGTNTYNIAGSFTLSNPMLYTVSDNSTYNFVATTTGHTINLASPARQLGNVVFNGVGGGWTLLTDLLCTPSNITLTAGALNLNNFASQCRTWTCTGTAVRSIAFGTSGIVISATVSSTTAINFANLTNFSYTGTSDIFVGGNGTGPVTINIGTTGATAANALNVRIFTNSTGREFTFTSGSVVRDLTTSGVLGIFTPPAALTIFGSLTAGASGTWTTGTGTITFASTSTGRTITTGGKTLANVTFNGIGGGWTLQNAFTAARALEFTAGQITLNNFILTCDSFASNNNNVRTIQFGTGSINLAGVNSSIPFDMGTNGNGFSYTGSGVVNLNYAGTVGRSVDTSSTFTAANALNFNITAGTYPLNVPSSSVFGDLNFTGFSGTFDLQSITIFGSLTFSPSMGVTSVNINTTNFAATSTGKTIRSAGKRFYAVQFTGTGGGWALQDAMQLDDTLILNNGTLSLNGFDITAPTFNGTGSATRRIDFSTSNINLTAPTGTLLNLTNATNFTLEGTGAFRLTANSSSGTRTATIGTTGGSSGNAPNLSVVAGVAGSTFDLTTGSWVADLNFTGFSGTYAPAASTNITGSLTAVSGMTWTTGTGTITFASTFNSRTITSAGKTLNNVTFNGVGGNWSLADAFTAANVFTITNGLFNSNNFNVSATTYTLTAGTVNMGSGNWTATGTTGTIWNCTGAVVNRGTSTIVFTSETEVTFAGGGATYYDFYINNSGAGAVNITGSNTFNRIYSVRETNWRLVLDANATNSFVNFNLGGSASTGSWVVVASSSSINPTTLVSVGGVVQNLERVTFENAVGSVSLTGASPIRWYLGNNSIVQFTIPVPTITGVVLDSQANGYQYYVMTSGTSWSVPANWNSVDNNVYLLGGGGGSAGGISVSSTGSKISGAGGGGGGFSALTNVTLTPSGSTPYAIGAAGAAGGTSSSVSTGGGGGTTTFNTTNTAGGGGGGSGTTTTSTGGAAGTGTTNNGGSGAAGTFTSNINRAGSGGGGAGGLQGPGLNGSVGGTDAVTTGGAGGAANNGLAVSLFGLLFYGDGGSGSSSGAVNSGFSSERFGGGAGGGSVRAGLTTDSAGTLGTQGAIIIRYRTFIPPSTATGNFLNFFYQ